MADLRLVEGGPEHADEIRALLAASFPANPKSEPGLIEWQYWSNPFGPTHTILGYAGERLVAHQTACSLPLTLGGERVVGAIKSDTATHPDYQRRGSYRVLMEAIAESCRADGIAVIVTNPNPNSLGLAVSFGFIEVAEPRLFALPIRSQWVEAMTGAGGGVASGLTRLLGRDLRAGGAERVAEAPAGLDGLVDRLWSAGLAGIRPARDWWRWRYGEHPARPYRIYTTTEGGALGAAIVVRIVERRGAPALHVLDLVASSRRSARAVVGAAIAEAPEVGGVTAVSSAHGPQVQALRWAGLRRVPRLLRGRRSHFAILPMAVGGDRLRDLRWSVTDGTLDHT